MLSLVYFSPGGGAQNREPDLDFVDRYLKEHWLHDDLNPVQPLVAQMLSYNPANRPRDVSQQLREMFPDVVAAVEEWIQGQVATVVRDEDQGE